MIKKICLLSLIIFFTHLLIAQHPRYLIRLTDKKIEKNPYSLENPGEFLSQKALQRRAKFQIALNQTDLPIHPGYLDSLKTLVFKVQNDLKWINSLVVEIDTSKTRLNELKNISFVESVSFLAPPRNLSQGTAKNGYQSESNIASETDHYIKDTNTYGLAANQILMLNGQVLHQNGYKGEGMTIAVVDGGFSRVDVLPAFDSLWANNQILGTKDFENHDNDVFMDHAHGTYVLSILAGNIPGYFYGSAPKASYWLLRSEVTGSEYLVEEYNWIAAAEFADSVGADIINTSLGYSEFDKITQNHDYQDMDGNTTPISKAAKVASSKGMLVVVSAGNLGNDPWHYISAPADADSILSVGAVDRYGSYASFSSTGPTADGRVKPDIAAQGQQTAFQYTDSSIVGGNGTSFSTPIISGLAACLWQYQNEKNHMEIIRSILENSNQYNNPDSLLGYGIPNFGQASGLPYSSAEDTYFADILPVVYPNPFKDSFQIKIPDNVNLQNTIQINIYNIIGVKVYNESLPAGNAREPITIEELKGETPGIYLLEITYDKNSVIRKKIIKTD